jgi:hypothetical protein
MNNQTEPLTWMDSLNKRPKRRICQLLIEKCTHTFNGLGS